MKLLTGFVCAAALLAAAAPAAAWAAAPPAAIPAAASVQDGLAAYMANRVAEAERIYAAVQANPAATAKDRSAAGRELGRIAWLVEGDMDRALAQTEAAVTAGDRPCVSGALQMRILRESGQAARALAAGDRFLGMCAGDADDADAVRGEAVHAGLDVAAGQTGDARAATLQAVALQLSAMSEAAKAGLDANEATLALGLLRGDAAQALAGWRGYFWLTGDKDAPQALASWQGHVNAAFEAGLKPGASAHDQAVLAELLMRTGFYRETQRLAADAGLATRAADDPAWKRVAAYFHFREQVDAVVLAENRKLAHGGAKDHTAFEADVIRLLKEAAAAAGVPMTLEAMTEQFGLYGTGVGETDGYPSWHVGHIVQDDRRPVDQYGRHGEIHFVGVDNMVSNGFESWLWDGRAATGGWADDGVVVQVRSGYADGPLKAWQLVNDTSARKRALEQLALDEVRDAQLLAQQPVVYLPGLSTRLDMQANAQILARAREIAQGGGEAELRTAFLAEYGRAVDQHSIFVHEGRHTLDALATAEHIDAHLLEYRAKLSELALSDYPRLALAAIDGPTLGTDSDHGRGNAMIMKAFGEWIVAHGGEVAGYDGAKPAMLQVDKLSDDQIRAVARSLDPWASAQP